MHPLLLSRPERGKPQRQEGVPLSPRRAFYHRGCARTRSGSVGSGGGGTASGGTPARASGTVAAKGGRDVGFPRGSSRRSRFNRLGEGIGSCCWGKRVLLLRA